MGHRRFIQYFDGHVAMEAAIVRTVDFPHATGPEEPENLVGTETCSVGKRHDEKSVSIAIHRELGMDYGPFRSALPALAGVHHSVAAVERVRVVRSVPTMRLVTAGQR